MKITDLARVLPFNYNTLLRWVNKIPSNISYAHALEAEKVTGIPWATWMMGHTMEGDKLTVEYLRSWPVGEKTIKELLPQAPFGESAIAEFQKRMSARNKTS